MSHSSSSSSSSSSICNGGGDSNITNEINPNPIANLHNSSSRSSTGSSSRSSTGSSSRSSISNDGDGSITNEINPNPIANLNAQKAAQRKRRWAELKTSDPVKYEQSLAKMRQYHHNTRDQRLAKQSQYRENRTEEQKEICRIKQKNYARTQRDLMKNAETQISNPTLLPSTANIEEMRRLADKRQRILANIRNYNNNQCKRWVNIEQVWDEDYPCRY